MGTIERIAAFERGGPTAFKQIAFLEADTGLARLTLIVTQEGGRFDNHLVAGLAGAQAEIHVIIVYREGFIKASELVKNAFADGQTGSGYGGDIAGKRQ